MTIDKAYQERVDNMLDRMPKGAKVRVAKITKKVNRPMFVEAVKNWMNRQPIDNGGVVFSSDYRFFRRDHTTAELEAMFSDKPNKITTAEVSENAKKEKARDALVKKIKARIKRGGLPSYAYNSAEIVHNTKFTLESGIKALEGSRVDTKGFDAWFDRMTKHMKKISDLDKAKKTSAGKAKGDQLCVFYYQFIAGSHAGEYYSSINPPHVEVEGRDHKIKEITLDEAMQLSKQ